MTQAMAVVAQEVDNGLPADLADLADVTHGDDAIHDGEQDQRHNDVLQQIDEDVAERLDVRRGDLIRLVYAEERPQDRADDNAEHHAEQDADAKAHFLLFFHILLLL